MVERMTDGFYAGMADKLKLLADTSLTRAESLTDQIKLADAPAQRSQLATNVITEIDNALAAIAVMTNQFAVVSAALHDAVDHLNRACALLTRLQTVLNPTCPALSREHCADDLHAHARWYGR